MLSTISRERLSRAKSHNEEAEHIQCAQVTLEHEGGKSAGKEKIRETKKRAGKMVGDVIKNQMLMTRKMGETVELEKKTKKDASVTTG